MKYLQRLLFISILFWAVSGFAAEIKTVIELKTAYPILVSQIEQEAKEGTVNQTTVTVEKDLKGNRSKWTEETKDSKGVLISKRVDEYTYYSTGEVDIITLKVFDSALKLISAREIKHYLNGRQPTVKVIK